MRSKKSQKSTQKSKMSALFLKLHGPFSVFRSKVSDGVAVATFAVYSLLVSVCEKMKTPFMLEHGTKEKLISTEEILT